MPIFEYRCPECGTAFEKLVLTRDEKRFECPKCGSKDTERLFSTFAMTGAAGRSGAAACEPSGAG